MSHPSSTDIGVLLVNLGTPDEPTAKGVRRYLAEFLWDPRVVNAPRPIWWLVLNLFILRFRPGRVAKLYQSIWQPEGSPLLTISRAQADKLQQALPGVNIKLAMTYGNPSIPKALAEFKAEGIKRILVLPLFPQYSSSTTAAIFDGVAKTIKKEFDIPEWRFVNEYHADSNYIQALAKSVSKHWETQDKKGRLLMSFHGIPKKYEDKGDPYPSQCRKTASLVAETLGLEEDEWFISFQSRFGPAEWVQPYTDKTLEAWGEEGVEHVDVLCPAFTSDCLETLEEIAEENKEVFEEAGGQHYHYIPCLNDDDDFIDCLAQLVKKHTQGWH